MRNKILPLLLSCLLILGCSSTSETVQDTDELSAAIVNWIGFAPLHIASELGYYQDLGLNMDIQVIEDLSAVKSAIQSNKIDLSWGTGDVLMTFADSGIDVKAFYAVDWSNGGDGVVVSNDYNDWKDFEGVEFSGQEGFPPSNLFLYALAKNGVDVSKVTLNEMDTAAAALAFKAGKVDVAAVYQPYLSEAAAREDGKIFLTSADYPYVITDYFAATPETLENKSNAIAKFIEGTDKAIQFIKSNQNEAAEIAAPYFGLTPEDALAIFMDVKFPSLKDNKKLFSSDKINDTFQTFEQAMKQAGVISKDIEVTNLYTDQFVK